MSGNDDLRGRPKISSLRDLPRDIAPPRDLWQGIEARIAADNNAGRVSAPPQRFRGGRAFRAGPGGFECWPPRAVIVALAGWNLDRPGRVAGPRRGRRPAPGRWLPT